ncbi:hypothetical protein [Bifidobacterium choloepi]|uniref:Uncharacterized protein n=1 Tax=Bifidobacterium choloepi TaxID=2614131 RepID=A0A6I5N7V3_9BIFI|nr:hypothetical protein [Bifidobacterium choloepi]NEG69921.1 hypothetical protein [Bifidobacterium choloepi]
MAKRRISKTKQRAIAKKRQKAREREELRAVEFGGQYYTLGDLQQEMAAYGVRGELDELMELVEQPWDEASGNVFSGAMGSFGEADGENAAEAADDAVAAASKTVTETAATEGAEVSSETATESADAGAVGSVITESAAAEIADDMAEADNIAARLGVEDVLEAGIVEALAAEAKLAAADGEQYEGKMGDRFPRLTKREIRVYAERYVAGATGTAAAVAAGDDATVSDHAFEAALKAARDANLVEYHRTKPAGYEPVGRLAEALDD